ncbi:hypothetical protein [Virgibacillus pantothenticus]|uniref:hypothetical protein n=1 Tax=Virgibacillus pantothenticus TaxID=1473 RepID=UPI0011159D36|nr:hypothetical protein [Virgibacillus pantothenticus]
MILIVGRISKVALVAGRWSWAHAPDVAIRLFRYAQAPHFILLYEKTTLFNLSNSFILDSILRI